MAADGATGDGSVMRLNVALLEMAGAEQASALRTLMLRLGGAGLLTAPPLTVATGHRLLERDVVDQVVLLLPAGRFATDLLAILHQPAVFPTEVAPTVLADRDSRSTTFSEAT
ncbi:MAG: hypothetical protein ACE10G_14665 [Gemmatimonadales bacterium]